MKLTVFDKNLDCIGSFQDASSVQWNRSWSGIGRFEIHIPTVRDIVKTGNYIMLNDNPELTGVITGIEDDSTGYMASEIADVTVTGYDLLYLINSRITEPPEKNDGYLVWNEKPAEDVMVELVKSQCVDTTEARKIPNLSVRESRHRGKKVTLKSRLKNVTDELTEISIQSGLGFFVLFDPESKSFAFEVREGVDRTYSGTHPNADEYVFSTSRRTVAKHTYTQDVSGYRTTAYVAGDGDGADRTIIKLGDETKGISRREVYIDARDLQSETDENGTEKLLKERGETKLQSEYAQVLSYEFETINEHYRVLWDLGDTCTFKDDSDVRLDRQITEVKEIYEGGAFRIEPTAGYTEKTVASISKSAAQQAVVERAGVSQRFEYIESTYAKVDDLEAEYLKAAKADIEYAKINTVEAISANVDTLSGEYAEFRTTVTGNLEAKEAEIKSLKTGKADVSLLTAANAEIDSLKTKNAKIDQALIGKASVSDLEAISANVDTLSGEYAEFRTTVTGNLEAKEAEIKSLKTGKADVSLLTAANAEIDSLKTKNAKIDQALIGKVSISDLKVEKLDVISTNLGVITFGELRSSDGLMTIDLNTGKGIEIANRQKDTTLKVDADGTRVVDTAGQIVAQFTSGGTETKNLTASGTVRIGKLLIQEVNGQMWFMKG